MRNKQRDKWQVREKNNEKKSTLSKPQGTCVTHKYISTRDPKITERRQWQKQRNIFRDKRGEIERLDCNRVITEQCFHVLFLASLGVRLCNVCVLIQLDFLATGLSIRWGSSAPRCSEVVQASLSRRQTSSSNELVTFLARQRVAAPAKTTLYRRTR